jgi:hypothetical protein
MTEHSLHSQLKNWYAREGDLVEAKFGNYVVDIVRDDLFIEIQTRNFSSIKKKLSQMILNHQVRLVYPIPFVKWITRLTKEGSKLTRRRSPKRGRVEELFNQLVYLPYFCSDLNAEVEVLLVNVEEYLIDDGKGSWRRRKWSIHDRELLSVEHSEVFRNPSDFNQLLPNELPTEFTVRQLSKLSKLPIRLTQRMAYCLRHMDVIELHGKKGRANLYRLKW